MSDISEIKSGLLGRPPPNVPRRSGSGEERVCLFFNRGRDLHTRLCFVIGQTAYESHDTVLQQRLEVLCVADGHGKRAAVLSVCGGAAAGLVGGAGLDFGQLVALRDEEGDN